MSQTTKAPAPLMCWTISSTPRNGCIKLSDEPPVWMILQTRELTAYARKGDELSYVYSDWEDVPMRNPENLPVIG